MKKTSANGLHRQPAFWIVLAVLACFYSWQVVNDSDNGELKSQVATLQNQLSESDKANKEQVAKHELEMEHARNLLSTAFPAMAEHIKVALTSKTQATPAPTASATGTAK